MRTLRSTCRITARDWTNLQQGVNIAAENIGRIGQFLKAARTRTMTPKQMAQRIAAEGSVARREGQAALAKAGEDKA